MKFCLSSSKPEVTMLKRKCIDFPPKVLYENRYCNQDDFSILVCGGMNKNKIVVDTVYKLYGPEYKFEKCTSMPKELYKCKTAIVNSDLLVLGGKKRNERINKSVIRFCNKIKTWSSIGQLSLDVGSYCVCSFKKKLYIYNVVHAVAKCFVYDVKKDKWIRLADTKEHRYNAACSVFEGKMFLLEVSLTMLVN